MTPQPFEALTDAQAAALRRLLAAGVAAGPARPGPEALQVVALADADAARRRAARLQTQRGLADPPMPPGELVAGLSSAVAAVRAQTTSTTKWSAVEAILARWLGLPAAAVYVTSVGGLSRNVAVRLTQSQRAREATVAAVVWASGGEPTQLAIAAATGACVEVPRLTLVFAIDTGCVDLAAVIAPSPTTAPAALTLAYPHAAVILTSPDRPSPDDA